MVTDGSLMFEKPSIGYRAQGRIPSYHHSLEYDNVQRPRPVHNTP